MTNIIMYLIMALILGISIGFFMTGIFWIPIIKTRQQRQRVNDFIRVMRAVKSHAPDVGIIEQQINKFIETMSIFDSDAFRKTEFKGTDAIASLIERNVVYYPMDPNDVYNPEMVASRKNALTPDELQRSIERKLFEIICAT